jgi:teichuronic acid biosynthesis glycosyltransferase TuaC
VLKNNKMKILFVSSGGNERNISPIVQNQSESLKKLGLQIEHFAIGGKGLNSYFSAIQRLRKKLRDNSFDLVHSHYGLSGIVSLFAGRRTKVLISFMGSDIISSSKTNGPGYFMNIFLIRINKFLSMYFYDYVIVKSSEMQVILDQVKNCSIIPNGVDLNSFIPADRNVAKSILGWSPATKHIIFVSDPDRKEKNYLLAREAVDLLNNNSVQIQTVSGIPNNQMCNYYNAADALLMTSFHEGSPNVIKEAMACNLPIISTDVGDVRWIIGETEGCFITSDSAEDIAEKINKALRFGKPTTGRERIIALGLDSESVASRIQEVYTKVLTEQL